VLRVGRRGGKSSTMCRVAVVETLFGAHVVPPGDIGTYLIIAQNTTQAAERLNTIRKILVVMGVEHAPLPGQAEGIKTKSVASGREVAFQVFAATLAGVSGPTGIGALFDEVAKWRDRETGANPATEVLRSARPTMATQWRTAREFMISSPFATLDAHYEAFEQGEDEEQLVAWAPSWEANPTLTEAITHTMERDFATWQREYKAIPMSAGTSFFFDHDVIDAALKRMLEVGERRLVAGLDAAFRRNAAACVPTARVGNVYGPLEVCELVPQPGAPLVPGAVVDEFSLVAKRHGCTEFVADSHYIESVREHGKRNNMRVHDGFTDKETAMIGARVIANSGGFALAGFERLARQLKEMKQKPSPSGRLTIFSEGASTSSHGDVASAYIEAVDFLAQGGGRIYLPPSLMSAGGGASADNRWGNDYRGF
jgi:hypothetical protein